MRLGLVLIIIGIAGIILTTAYQARFQMAEVPITKVSSVLTVEGKEKVPVVIVLKGKPATMEAMSIQSLAILDLQELEAEVYSNTTNVLNTISARIPADKIEELASKDFVIAVYPDVEYELLDAVTKNNAWAIKLLNITTKYSGEGVTVYVLDSGIQNSHPGRNQLIAWISSSL